MGKTPFLRAILQELILSLVRDFDRMFIFLGNFVVLSIVVALNEVYLEEL